MFSLYFFLLHPFRRAHPSNAVPVLFLFCPEGVPGAFMFFFFSCIPSCTPSGTSVRPPARPNAMPDMPLDFVFKSPIVAVAAAAAATVGKPPHVRTPCVRLQRRTTGFPVARSGNGSDSALEKSDHSNHSFSAVRRSWFLREGRGVGGRGQGTRNSRVPTK